MEELRLREEELAQKRSSQTTGAPNRASGTGFVPGGAGNRSSGSGPSGGAGSRASGARASGAGKRCGTCDSNVAAGAKFCPECGSAVH